MDGFIPNVTNTPTVKRSTSDECLEALTIILCLFEQQKPLVLSTMTRQQNVTTLENFYRTIYLGITIKLG